MHPRVLIVGTVPYSKSYSSRAFDAYFHNWEKENLRQIFSNPNKPTKGHCGSLFQITDSMVLQKWKHSSYTVGRVFEYDELDDSECQDRVENKSAAYKIGKKHTPLIRLLRGMLWKKNKWCSKELVEWADSFKPECIFLAFSDDYFINKIALFFAKRYNIPIVSCIGDDYYFNNRFSINPFYWIYRTTYKRLIRKVLTKTKEAIYISDKIKKKYNDYFGLEGETIYLVSNITRKAFKPIDKINPLITYFGNIRMGRNQSLCDIAEALHRINPNYQLSIFSNESDKKYYKKMLSISNISYGGAITYAQVAELMSKSDITIIVEGFKKKDINYSRYSLSTKAADCLASGVSTLVYGSSECGVIEYMENSKAAVVCKKTSELLPNIENIINNRDKQKEYYENQITTYRKNHLLQRNNTLSEELFEKAIHKSYDK